MKIRKLTEKTKIKVKMMTTQMVEFKSPPLIFYVLSMLLIGKNDDQKMNYFLFKKFNKNPILETQKYIFSKILDYL